MKSLLVKMPLQMPLLVLLLLFLLLLLSLLLLFLLLLLYTKVLQFLFSLMCSGYTSSVGKEPRY